MSFEKCTHELKKLKNPTKAKILAGFFKTGKGEYGEGDEFLGITVPLQRIVAKKFIDLKFLEIEKLLNSKIHEHRLVSLLILVEKYRKGDEKEKSKVVNIYLKKTRKINNWDLVDLSAYYILGDYLLDKDRKILYKLAQSKNIWEKRIAIISTFAFIRAFEFQDTLKISKILLKDNHDLIHKAVGWMLREVGKRDQTVEENFLMSYYSDMSRTTLRYAIEKFPERKRQFYLRK